MKRKFVLALMASMAMLGAKADGPFRNARWDSFHCLKPAGTDIVFVGNSITNMHQWWEALGGQNNVLNRGTSGGFTTEVLSNLEAITAGHPKKVFIGIGTNDICEVLSLETTADNVRIIAERIARECPETEVYIQSLIPSTSDGNHVAGGGRNGRVLQVNALIQAHAEALAAKGLKVTYLDVNTPLRDPNNPNALKTSKFGQKIAFDDLHPNAVGYKYWLDTIKEETGYDCIYEEKEMPRPMNNNVYDDCLSGFEQFKVSGDDILMVGGDMIHNGEWHEFMKSGHFKNRGMGWGLYGITIANLNTIVERSLAADGSEDPKAIVIYAGDKDSNNGTAAATQFEAYKTAIEGIKAKAPTSKIFVLSAMPNTDNTKNGIVQELNSKMKAYAAQGDYTFVDAYAEIATNRQLYMNNTGYVYTRGYAKIAQVLAESLNAKLGTDYHPITDEEAEANVNTYNARTTLGNAVTGALRVLGKEGDGVGQYSASALSGISAKANNAFDILSAASFDANAAAAAAEELRNLNVSATPNLPLASTANDEHWYTLVSSQRGSRYVGSNGTRTIGYSDSNVFARNQWKFVARGENSFDIINRQDNRYLAPSGNDAPLTITADQPANGWEFSYGVTAGTFIIQNGTCEINMTNKADGSNNKVVNWSTNYAGNDHSDDGCQFKIEEYTGNASSVIYLPVSSTDSENHFYTIQSKRGGRYVTKSESDVRGIAETSNGAYWRFYDRGDGTYNVKAVNETYLNPADGQTSISAPSTGWTLSASNEAGYVILKSGSNQLHQYNSGQYLLGNYGNGTNLGDEGCQFRIAVYEGDVQLEEAPEVVLPTEDANVIVSPNNGTGVGSSFTKQWISNDKLVTISVGANNMTANNGSIDFRSGSSKTATYTITPADGYYVSGYSFVTTGANSITITGNGSTATASAEGTPFTATVTEGTTASFTVADNANSQNVLSNFHVRLTPVGAQPSTNIDGSELAPVVYTIASYVKNPETTRYLKNEDGRLVLAEASTLDASDNKYQWTLRANGSNYDIVSVADGKVLDYAQGLSVAGTPFAMGEGTTPEYTSLHNSVMGGGRYLAASADGAHFGTTSGNGYYAQNKVQTNGWSTDFIFTEVPDDTDETTFVSERVIHLSDIVPGAKIAMKVNVSGQNNGFYAIPNGNADTETWFTVAEGSTSSTLRLMTADGKYVGTSTTKYVEAADALDFVVTAEGDNTANAKYIFKNTGSTHGITLENNASLPAAYWALGGAPRLRFEVYKQTVAGPAGFDGTYTISSNTGTLYHTNGSANQSYNAVWKSSKTPQLQFGCGVNNMRYSGTNLELMTGQSGSSTYTISAPAGYVITGYSFNYANNNHDSALNFTHNGVETQTTREAQRISVEDVEIKNASFTIDGDNAKGILLTEFVVTIEPFTAKPPVVSTEGDVKWYYIVNASSKNYCRDKVMYYEPEGDRMKFANKSFDARYIWSFWRGENGKLAIKNYKGEFIGTAGGTKGSSSAFGKNENANYIYNINEAFGFFTINDGGVPLHAQDANSVIVRWDAEADGASLWRFEKADITHAEAVLSSTQVQQGKVSTGRGNKNVPIIRSTMKVNGLEGNVTFSSVKGKVTGTNLADISNVQAYFATDNRELHVADSRMEWRNSNAVLYGAAATIGDDGQFTITGENKALEPGTYYLWITFDVAANAKEGNKVDAQITSYTINGDDAPETNGNPQHEATVFLSEGTVLMAGDGKFDSKYFRIPAITTTADGKRLVTLTDDRLNHNGDLPSHVYITAQYSDDNGQTWSEPKIVAGEAATGGDYAHGDAQIITNRVNGDIVGIMTCATNGQGFWGSSPERPQTWKTIISHDNGETWTVPVDHTKELYAAGSPNPLWKGGFSGSGAGLQKRDGTLVSPFVNRDENGNRQFVLFESVDAGESWHVAGNPCMINEADEPKVLERNNGDLAISVRATGRNFHNETSDNGLTWNHPVNTRFTTGISGNACDGEYMVWCSTLDGNERNIAFQTVPNNGSRQNVSIALSLDEGETFLDPKTICPRGSAYSAATVLADGTLGVYYEEVGVNDGYTMRFVRFSLDWASDHKYGFTAEKPYKRYTSLQAIVNAILKNVYKGVTVGNAANEIKHLTDAAE